MKLKIIILIMIVVMAWLLVDCRGRHHKQPAEAESDVLAGNIKNNWESIKTYPIPEWFQDAKFGIMIHWGVYAVPAWTSEGYAEWYPHKIYSEGPDRDYHIRKYGPTEQFGYKDFVPMFKAENWDPDDWAELFLKAGARYVVPVGEHHDGFAMWDSDLTHWDAMEKGPKRDIIGELGASVRKRNMKYAPSYHRERHFAYFDSALVASEIAAMPEAADLYGPFSLTRAFIEDYVARWKELERKYRPDFMWLDHVPIFFNDSLNPVVNEFKHAMRDMIADYLNQSADWGKEVYFNNKGRKRHGINFPIGAGIREADNLDMDDPGVKWQNPATIAESYGYHQDDDRLQRYKSTDELISLLVDVVSKNGNLLLNVGPKADGTIPEGQRQRLLGIGEWLEINGEAIYGTRPRIIYREGPHTDRYHLTSEDIRFTVKGNCLYAVVMDWPQGDTVELTSLPADKIVGLSLLGYGDLSFTDDNGSLLVHLPEARPCDHAFVLKFTMSDNNFE
jgi:alpha-L-fucosidase